MVFLTPARRLQQIILKSAVQPDTNFKVREPLWAPQGSAEQHLRVMMMILPSFPAEHSNVCVHNRGRRLFAHQNDQSQNLSRSSRADQIRFWATETQVVPRNLIL